MMFSIKEFAASLPHLYRADRPDKLRKSVLERLQLLSPTDPNEVTVVYVEEKGNDESEGRKNLMVIIVSILCVVLGVAILIIGGMHLHISKLQVKLDSKLLSTDKL
jgi:hypothetical protein